MTENLKLSNQSALVCPRVVRLNGPEKNARILVRICNVTARLIKI